MRKSVTIGIAALGLFSAYAATAGSTAGFDNFQQQPQTAQGHAYFAIPFGGDRRLAREPFHYGLRLDYSADQSFLVPGQAGTALAQFDLDSGGNRLAMVGGVPFAGHIQPLHQNEGDSSGSSSGGGTGSGGFTFFDWSLLAVGVGGLGYLIYEVSKSKDSKDPPRTTNTTTGTGTTTATSIPGQTSGLVDAITAATGYRAGANGAARSDDRPDAQDRAWQRWLDGGTGQMGDLAAARP